MFTRLCTALLIAFTLSACAPKTIPIVVGQTGLAVVQSIGQLQATTKQLTDANILPPAVALVVQQKLLALNAQAKPLPGILTDIDTLEKAGSSTTDKAGQAIAILQALSSSMTTVVAGVPTAAQALLDAVQATETTITTTLAQVAKLKGQ